MMFLLSVAGSVIFFDQLTKWLILHFLPLHSGKVIVPGFFNLVHVHNTGAAFSMFAGADAQWRQPFFVGVTILTVGILAYVYRKLERGDRWTRTAYALIIGGALGNLIDRIRFGSVVDFLDFYIGSYHWPAFNVADSAISLGAGLLLLSLMVGGKGRGQRRDAS